MVVRILLSLTLCVCVCVWFFVFNLFAIVIFGYQNCFILLFIILFCLCYLFSLAQQLLDCAILIVCSAVVV